MAPSAASGVSSLPSGFAVFTTFPDLLFIFEFVSGWRAWRRRRRQGRQDGMGRGVRSPLPQAARVRAPRVAGEGKALPNPHPAMLLWPLLAQDKPSRDLGGKTKLATRIKCRKLARVYWERSGSKAALPTCFSWAYWRSASL